MQWKLKGRVERDDCSTISEEPELLEEKMKQNQESIGQNSVFKLKVVLSFFVKGCRKAGLTSQVDG